MSDLLPISPFASALTPDPEAIIEQVVQAHTAMIIQAFRQRYDRQLSAFSAGLYSLIGSVDQNLDFETAWDPALGGLHYAISVDPDSLRSRAVAFALRLHERGHGGEWRAPIEDYTRFHFDRWPLPEGEQIQLESDGKQVRIKILMAGKNTNMTFKKEGGEWLSSGTPSPLPEAVSGDRRVRIWRRRELWTKEVRFLAEAVDDSEPEFMADRCGEAMALLREDAPIHYAWVERVLRFVAPWKVTSDIRPSGSSSSNLAPGLIGAGNHDHIVSLADTLVHEASHHYFYVALLLGPAHDGSDTNLYFNPFLELDRPIDRILLAYHAFANVLTFCHEATFRGHAAYLDTRVPQLVRGLKIMEKSLSASMALTPNGRVLLEELRGQIHD